MKLNWTKGLEGQAKEDMEKSIASSAIALNRLEELIKEFDKTADNLLLSTSTLKETNWAYAQAVIVGERNAYKKILQLLDQGK